MMEKYFNINEAGHSIRCKMYENKGSSPAMVVLFGHGFGGHKENKAAERFAGKLLTKHKDTAVLVFDWPCHGEDGKKKLTLSDCDTYIRLLKEYVSETMGVSKICVYATSFGGYLFLKYISENANPFYKIALRCPAVNMYDVICSSLLREEDRDKLRKGKPVLIGFDRLVKIDEAFLDSLKEADITQRDFMDYADDILFLQGTKDEVVPTETVLAFAEENVIETMLVQNADHRFMDPQLMDYAIHRIILFFET